MDRILGFAVLLLITILAGGIALALESVLLRAAFALMPQPHAARSLAFPTESGTRLAAQAFGQRR